MKKIFVSVLILAILFTACVQKPKSDDIRTWYEVFVRSFADSNGDGVGDIKGLTEKLDYIEELGFDGIWLMPISPSPTYHKYDVTDYTAIDPQYGTMQDFHALMAECGKRDIRVILDLVINHTSVEHQWFKAAIQALKNGDMDNEYIKYYNFVDQKPAKGGYSYTGAKNFYYECMFWEGMPDLNLDNQSLRNEFEKIMEFWLDKGVSGFRLDAVKEFYSGEPTKNINALKWINSAATAIDPKAYFVGENWDTTTAVYDYYESGINSFFDFPFSNANGAIAKALIDTTRPAIKFAQSSQQAYELIKSKNENATNASFLTNHDSPRASGFLKRDAALIKMAWGMNLMQTGQAFVYYGEEIGMSGSGKDENKRGAMYWSQDEDGKMMCESPPEMVPQKHAFPSVQEQMKDDMSIYSFVKSAIAMRNKYPAIARGDVKALQANTPLKVCFIEKTYDSERIVLGYNLSAEEQSCDVKELGVSKALDTISHSNQKANINENRLVLPAYSIAVLK